MKYLSLFSGIGGFEYGISRAIQNAECIGYSEIDKYATAIYKYHYPENKELGNARDIICERLPDFDLLVGGFPCQTFSIAGKRAGFDDTRGTLFFEIARILRNKRPRHFVLENVEGLLSHNDGKTFHTILAVLSDIGFRVEWQVLNSRFFNVPQNRPRVFIVGHLRGECAGQIFPFEESDEVFEGQGERGKKERKRVRDKCASAITANYHKGVYCGGETYIGTLRNRPGEPPFKEIKDGVVPCLNGRARQDGDMQPVIYQRPHGYNKGGTKELPCLRSSSMEHNDFLLQDGILRRMTPLECERAQGFPDNWTQYGIIAGKKVKISDTQRYKCIGNAVTTNIITEIFERR